MGIAIEHTSFDRCGYARLSLRHKQQHLELEKEYKASGTTTVDEQCLTRWDVSTPCTLRDLHSSSKWGVKNMTSPQKMKDLWVINASLRNSYDLFIGNIL